jgi:two-component system, cell cycle sensor histidine kinase and response regulator CckA
MALLGLDSEHPLRNSLLEIQKAGERSANLTRQLLAFARKQTISPRVIDLNDTIAGMLKMLGRLIGENIDLLWMPGYDVWPVKMDPVQVDQILANLIVNARDAITSVGKITIETDNAIFDEEYCSLHTGFMPGEFTMLAISDNGCGMDRETLASLFEPFFTTKPKGQGTGLGLATVYGIVKQNQGFINVYSEAGRGSTFKIYIPRRLSSESTCEEKPMTLPVQSGTETILLVEDEAAMLDLAKRLIEQLGYRVLPANSPSVARRWAQEYPAHIDLLLTDVVMPEMNGRDLWQELVALRPGIKCLFMSGYTENAIAHHGVLEEGVHFLAKPFSLESLASRLREALAGV